MLRLSLVSSLTLPTLVLILSSLILVNASVVSVWSEQQALNKIASEIAGISNSNLPDVIQTEINRIFKWIKTLDLGQSVEVIQGSKKTRKRKHNEILTSSYKDIGFETSVKQFLSTIKMLVETFFSLSPDYTAMTYTLRLTINDCEKKFDRCLSFKRSHLVDAMKIFKDLIKIFVIMLRPDSLTISEIFAFALQFESLLQSFEFEAERDSDDFQRLWTFHYQLFATSMINKICPILPCLFTYDQFHKTRVNEIALWQSKVKDLFAKTKEIHLLAESPEKKMTTFEKHFRNIQKESIVFWVYVQIFLSKVLEEMKLIQTYIPLKPLYTLINKCNINIYTMIRSPNYISLYEMQDLIPVDPSQFKVLSHFVDSLGVLSRLIGASSILFGTSLITESAIQNIHHCIQELKSRLRNDFNSYLNLLARMLPKMNNIPDSSFSGQLNKLVKKFDNLAKRPSLYKIHIFITTVKVIMQNMKKRMENYTNDMKDLKKGQLFFIDVSKFSVKACDIWKPLEIFLLTELNNVIHPLLNSDPKSNLTNEIQSQINALKNKVSLIVQKIEPDEYSFDQVLGILNLSKNLIEIIDGCIKSNQLTKGYTSLLKKTLEALVN